jgi:hypothetical protein
MTKPKLTEHVIAEIVGKMRIAGSLDTGLVTCGIMRPTYDTWVEEYRDGEAEPLVVKLIEAIALAEAELKMVREHQLAGYFEKNWQALAWWLERKYPGEYGPKAKDPGKQDREDDEDLDVLLSRLPGNQ